MSRSQRTPAAWVESQLELGVVQVVGRGVFPGLLPVRGTGQVHLDQHVGEGQDGVGRVHAHRARQARRCARRLRFAGAKSARLLAARKASPTTWAASLPRARVLAVSQDRPAPVLRLVVSPGMRTRHRASDGGADGDGALRCHLARVAGQRLRGRGVGGGHAHLGAGGQLASPGPGGRHRPGFARRLRCPLRLKLSPSPALAVPPHWLTLPRSSNFTFIRP